MAVLATQGFQLLVGGAFMAVRGSDLAEAVIRVTSQPVALATAQLLGFGVVLRLVARSLVRDRRPDEPLRQAFGLGAPPPPGLLALCVVAGLALQLPLSEIANGVQEVAPVPMETQQLRQQLVEPASLPQAIAALFAFVVVAPLTEELLFRGVLLPGLEPRYGPGVALVLSSLLFAVIHFDWSACAYGLVAGLLLGALRIRSGSLWPCLALHAGVNVVPLLIPRALFPIEGFNLPSEVVLHVPPELLFPSLGVAAVTLGLIERRTRPR